MAKQKKEKNIEILMEVTPTLLNLLPIGMRNTMN